LTRAELKEKIISDDIPQAFSHWTYQYSQRTELICDLQGVFNQVKFQLTDPAIHTTEETDYFGPTNLGKKGINSFYKTHKCNPLCKYLGLKLY